MPLRGDTRAIASRQQGQQAEGGWHRGVLGNGFGEALLVIDVKVGGGLVQSENATVHAEGLGQRKPNDQRRKNLAKSEVIATT